MKQLKRIVMLVVIFLTLVVASACSNKGIDNISCDAAITARRDKITVIANFIDSEKRVFNTITPSVAIHKFENNKVGERINSRSLSIKPGTDYAETTTSDEVVFNGLEENKEYTVKVLITGDNGYETELFTQKVQTTLDGSDSEHAISIKTIDDFIAIKNDREGFFKLENDIDFNGKELGSMFYLASSAFTGEFDGNNHKLSNFSIKCNQEYAGLFGYNDGVIKNLNIDKFTLNATKGGTANIGLISGYNTGVITNCHVTNSTLKAESTVYSSLNDFNVGGLVGRVAGDEEKIEVSNCSLTNSTVTATLVNNGSVGGAFGIIDGPVSLRNQQKISTINVNADIKVTQNLKTNVNKDVNFFIGGFGGQLAGNISDAKVKSNIVVKTNSVDSYYSTVEENKEKDILKFDVFVGGFGGRNIPNQSINLNNIAFEGTIDVNNALTYTEAKPDGDKPAKVKHLDFNLYVGSLFGELSTKKIRFAVSKVSDIKLTATKSFIEGTHNINYGKLFGKSNLEENVLTTNNIKLFADITEVIKNDNNYTLVMNNLNNINSDLTGFSDFIKK